MNNNYYSKVFGWLFVGLAITFVGGYLVSAQPGVMAKIFSGSLYYIICIAEVVVAVILGVRIHKMQPSTAKILYILYAFLTGLTFSSIFLIFSLSSITSVFLISSLLFGIFALIGSKTKFDLSKIGTFLLMGLIGVIVLEIVNIFILSNTLNMGLCILSLIIFLGYTAYDIQRIGYMADSGEIDEKYAIYGAFQLYLDFINIFIKLLRLFGKERD